MGRKVEVKRYQLTRPAPTASGDIVVRNCVLPVGKSQVKFIDPDGMHEMSDEEVQAARDAGLVPVLQGAGKPDVEAHAKGKK